MRANEFIMEGKWYEFDKPITLYHGTSSQLEDKIRTEGLSPLIEGAVSYVMEVLKDYGYEHDKEIVDKVLKQISQFRPSLENLPSGKTEIEKALYFFPSSERVEVYAKSYAQHGGELAWEAWHIIKFAANKGDLIPRWTDAVPIVVEVEVPRDWIIMHNYSLEKIYNNITSGDKGYSVNLDDISGNLEIRVAKHIPISMIKSIRKV